MTESRADNVLPYQPPRARRAERRRWPSPPGVVFNLWVLLLFVASMWVWRTPNGAFLLGGAIVLVWGVTGLAWLLMVLPHLRTIYGRGVSRHVRRLTALPLLLAVATVALVATDVPRQAAFAVSKPAMVSLAENQAGAYQGWAGVYRVRLRQDDRGGVIFVTNSIGIFSDAGYAYFPNGAPGPASGAAETFVPLGDGWYIYRFVD